MTKSPVIRLDEKDNVVVARVAIAAGTPIVGENIVTLQDVPLGHKVATRLIKRMNLSSNTTRSLVLLRKICQLAPLHSQYCI